MKLLLICTQLFSFVAPAGAWSFTSNVKVTGEHVHSAKRSFELSVVPSAQADDLLRVGHRDEVKEPVIIHKDYDKAEKDFEFEEAHAILEDFLGFASAKPLPGIQATGTSTKEPKTPTMRTPREKHFLMTALDSWKKMEVQDDDEMYWDSWPLVGI